MTVTWIAGPPPGRGRWWVVLNGVAVACVAIEPALIHLDNPVAPLLVKLLGGLSYPFGEFIARVTHHAVFEAPSGPARAALLAVAGEMEKS